MKPSRFFIFGERCSGTNHAEALIIKHFSLEKRTDCGWKHALLDPSQLGDPKSTLFVLVVRNFPDWLRSFHLTPHHLGPALRGLSLHEFVQHRMDAILDHACGLSPFNRHFGLPMKAEHDKSGRPAHNPMKLRKTKHKRWLHLLRKMPFSILVRHEDMLTQPHDELLKISQMIDQPLRDTTHEVTHYKGREEFGSYRPKQYEPIEQDTANIILSQLDLKVEAELGYNTEADVHAATCKFFSPDFTALAAILPQDAATTKALQQLEGAWSELLTKHQAAVSLAEEQRSYLISLFEAIEHHRPKSDRQLWLNKSQRDALEHLRKQQMV